jgi:hypothetical protein
MQEEGHADLSIGWLEHARRKTIIMEGDFLINQRRPTLVRSRGSHLLPIRKTRRSIE